ncbi:MAG: MFS transporter [Coriobacteriales bacterium]|jgi:MFS family permease|nr:MFS transporter [Coriobacteriales bacterium]
MSEIKNAFERAPQGKKMLTLVAIYVCTVFAVMQSSGISIVLPIAAAEFDAISGTGQAMQLYSLTASVGGPVSIILMPLWGYIAARSPHLKKGLLAASVLIGGAALLLRAFATNIFIVIFTGVLWGFVSPGVYVVGFMLIRDMFPANKVGIYMGLIGTMMGIGSLASPVLTGFVAAISWRAACHMLWPFFIVGALMVIFGVGITKAEGEEIANKSGSIDFAGIIFVALFLAPLILGISMGTSFIPFGSPISFVTFAIAIAALIALIITIRKKGEAAVIPLPALKDRNTVMLSLSNFCMNFANMFVFFFLPTYVIYVMQPTDLGLEPSAWSGILMACFAVFGLFLGPIFGRMIAKSGNARNILLLGTASRLIFLLCMIFFLTPAMNIFLLMGLSLVLGGVYSVMATAYTTGVSVMAPAKLRQQSNAVVQMGQNLGGAPGTAIGGILIATFGIANGMPIAFIVAAVATVIMFIPTALLKRPADYGQDGK